MYSDVPDLAAMQDLCEAIDTPESLKWWLLISHKEYEQMTTLDFEPYLHSSPFSAVMSLQLNSLLTKWKGWSRLVQMDRAGAAIRKWRLAEDACRRANQRFQDWNFSEQTSRILREARTVVHNILGEEVPVHDWMSECKWGPGATSSVKRRRGLNQKISEVTSCTPMAKPWLDLARLQDIHWFQAVTGLLPDGPFCWTDDVVLTEDCVMELVPKNFKIDRPIAKEPTANSFLQQGLHAIMRKKLKSAGVNLDDQSKNQELAKRAYKARLATIDLSSASDTVCVQLVRFLFPEQWFRALSDLRSPRCRLPTKEVINLEKFSSMGNATTFEIETIVFFSLALACESALGTGFIPSVYGDDIISTDAGGALLTEVLPCLGFTVNLQKSFLEGSFYESCGSYFFQGLAVKPVFFKEEVLASRSSLVRAHNKLYRWCVYRTRSARKRLRKLYQERYGGPLPLVPDYLERDDGFLCDERQLRRDPNHGWLTFVVSKRPATRFLRSDGGALAWKMRHPRYLNPVRGWYKRVDVDCAYESVIPTAIPFASR